MKIIKEFVPNRMNELKNVLLCSLVEENHILYGLASRKKILYLLKRKETEIIYLSHIYTSITYDSENGIFYAIGCNYQNNRSESIIYRLDNYLNEIDNIKLGYLMPSCQIKTIWYDKWHHFLFLVFSSKIEKYNVNGDFLGNYMSAVDNTTYSAICTFKQFLFICYRKKGCLFIASYTWEGAYLERINIGGDYLVQNMQVVLCSGYPTLMVYAIKNGYIPIVIQINLEGQCREEEKEKIECQGIKVEVFSEEENHHTTCYMDEMNI